MKKTIYSLFIRLFAVARVEDKAQQNNTSLRKRATSPPNIPNIIYILADDMGYRDLSCHGQQILSTPHID